MKVHEAMTRDVRCISPEATLQEAARMMKELDVGPLPVCGENNRLAGMVTDRDIIVRAIAEGKDPRTTLVRDAMTPQIRFCFEDDDVADAADSMKEHQIRRLVVLNRGRQLVGILSLGDLALDSGDEHLIGSALEAVSEPAGSRR